MIEIKSGNLFDTLPSSLICHQVNCKGVMGRGVALSFKKLYPTAFEKYVKLCKETPSEKLLGSCLFCRVPLGYTCCMFAQNNYKSNGCNTDYNAFRRCCQNIKIFLTDCGFTHYTVDMPYGIGCDCQ